MSCMDKVQYQHRGVHAPSHPFRFTSNDKKEQYWSLLSGCCHIWWMGWRMEVVVIVVVHNGGLRSLLTTAGSVFCWSPISHNCESPFRGAHDLFKMLLATKRERLLSSTSNSSSNHCLNHQTICKTTWRYTGSMQDLQQICFLPNPSLQFNCTRFSDE